MTSQKHTHHHQHLPVLLEEVLDILQPCKGESFIDFTAGYGGHAREVIQRTRAVQKAVLVDRDQTALDSLSDLQKKGAHLLHKDFAAVAAEIVRVGDTFDMILMDLGVSSPHLDNPERGFSFRFEAPLDMRMDQRQPQMAQHLVNELPEQSLAAILSEYGEEPLARRIARTITAHRPVETTEQLVEIVKKVYRRAGRGHSRTHPATRTFQALRMAVNQEIEQLHEVLPLLPELLSDDGRVAIISFHSLEDRLVKRFFAEEAGAGYEARIQLLTKKPIVASANESVNNPRSRSAKLRAGAKINKQNTTKKGV